MPFTVFSHQYLQTKRNSYSYPAVALQGKVGALVEKRFRTMHDLDNFLHSQLVSKNNEQMLNGYLSVIFWGHYSGQNGKVLINRALGKVKLAYQGQDRKLKNGETQRMKGVLDVGVGDVLNNLSTAIRLIQLDQCGEALNILTNLPGLGMAFASKICAFIDPNKCGVVDSVIAAKHPCFGFSLTGKYVSRTNDNCERYDAYCDYLRKIASDLNADEDHATWTDRDESKYPWRAVDVERALY